MSFAHLHVHTRYSIGDGLSSIDELFAKAEQLGQPGLAITDQGFLYGVPEFMKVAGKHPSVKPVIGCEIYLTDYYDHHYKDSAHKKYYHLILLAKNQIGYRNLLKICSEAAIAGLYCGTPRISHDFLEQYHEGLIAISSGIGGEISALILKDNELSIAKAMDWYKRVFRDDFYLEVLQPDSPKNSDGFSLFEKQKEANERIFSLAKRLAVKVVATNDVHYVNAEDVSAMNILLCTTFQEQLKDKSSMRYSGENYLKSEEEMLGIFPEHPEAISNTMDVLDKIENFSIWGKPQIPEYPIPEKYQNADDALRGKVYWYLEEHGWNEKEEYKARIEKELSMIKERHCADYFLIVSDLCDKVWERGGIVGPGRGSASSLFINYLLGITEINPMEFGLLPEKFFSYNLDISPDIDIDFDSIGHEITQEYLVEKYGCKHTAKIISFEKRSLKDAIIDSFMAHGISQKSAENLCEIIDDTNEVRNWYENADNVERKAYDDASRIVDSIKSTDINVCGWLLSKEPLTDYIPLANTDTGQVISQYDSRFCEDCGPVKLDFLKLRHLSAYALSEIESLDDRQTIEIFSSGDTTGVFQFEFEGMKRWLKEIGPDRFEQLVAINAMCRPGILGRMQMYSVFKNGTFKDLPFLLDENPFVNLHHITDETYGMILYQEQLMELVSKVASFSLMDQRRICKFAGPNKPNQMIEGEWVDILDNFREKFLARGIQNGYDEDALKHFWDGFVCSNKAQYLVNKAHMVSYTFIAYRLAFLKAHHTAEFYNTLYPILKSDEDRKALYDDALKHGLVFMKDTGNFYSIVKE